jgi:hypothetical protein
MFIIENQVGNDFPTLIHIENFTLIRRKGGGAASILLGTTGTGCGSASTEIIINYLF